MTTSLKTQFLKLEHTVGFALPPRAYTSNVRSFYHHLTQLHSYCDKINSSCYSLPEDPVSKIGLTLHLRVFTSKFGSFCHRLTERHSSYSKTDYSCDSLLKTWFLKLEIMTGLTLPPRMLPQVSSHFIIFWPKFIILVRKWPHLRASHLKAMIVISESIDDCILPPRRFTLNFMSFQHYLT